MVEDQPQLLRLLVRIFDGNGFRVLSSPDGITAFELFEKHQREIDVVLLDVMIPPGGVRSVLEKMWKLREDLGVVLMSGDNLEPELRSRLQTAQGVFLRKPFAREVALAAVRSVAGRGVGATGSSGGQGRESVA